MYLSLPDLEPLVRQIAQIHLLSDQQLLRLSFTVGKEATENCIDILKRTGEKAQMFQHLQHSARLTLGMIVWIMTHLERENLALKVFKINKKKGGWENRLNGFEKTAANWFFIYASWWSFEI